MLLTAVYIFRKQGLILPEHFGWYIRYQGPSGMRNSFFYFLVIGLLEVLVFKVFFFQLVNIAILALQ